MYRRYYSYNDMPSVAKHSDECSVSEKSDCCDKNTTAVAPVHNECNECQKTGGGILDSLTQNGKLFGKFEIDDVLLIVIILFLVLDDCDDNLLLIALGFIFISGII